ncbi:MAG: NUDIX domain-containing protein [Candidatus Micrarchaeales archaeon]|jgi:8-oxo-dGTP diphosphatase
MREKLVGIMLSRNYKILVEIRRKTDDFGSGAVWIPGGHVEKNETLEEATVRESEEEFGIKLITLQKICVLLWKHKNKDYEIHYFASKKWKGKIKNKEAGKLIWISKEEINKLDENVDKKAFKQYLNQN